MQGKRKSDLPAHSFLHCWTSSLRALLYLDKHKVSRQVTLAALIPRVVLRKRANWCEGWSVSQLSIFRSKCTEKVTCPLYRPHTCCTGRAIPSRHFYYKQANEPSVCCRHESHTFYFLHSRSWLATPHGRGTCSNIIL